MVLDICISFALKNILIFLFMYLIRINNIFFVIYQFIYCFDLFIKHK